jgi:hypothetical protein
MGSEVPISNPPVVGNVSDFQSLYRTGWFKLTRFAVRFNLPPIFSGRELFDQRLTDVPRDLTFLCEAAEVTGRGLQTMDVRYYGPSMKYPFNSQYNDLNVTILCRKEMKEKKFFDYWLNKINPTSTYDFNFLSEYSSDLDIYVYGEDMESNYHQTCLRAYPLNVAPIQTNWAEENIGRLTVTFTFQRFKTRDDPVFLPRFPLILDAIIENDSILGSAFVQ